ncbi:bifunctional hydroxymethylpyrimidine kinase/phosphomethylpyrimidine kinase [Nocardia sp. CS682]|uniref:bifunctional hydroxymethylpyrimidine kinase/phosphomethylpyrimidine kinase n=1 Tax=Nocardia sp. CS682 TaxID=1047172 RepID=UPI0010755AEF|nr:bifunctional hydroxymethylpyrimidine kinase/phosphomethylpyrimidine kinase [Nocardia sp. CS682]QBS44528.1 bifunctional hydroxymethylpyrimidine kinase/phosphomethylpyrimidine kinase [Nocardia sp. CS682]
MYLPLTPDGQTPVRVLTIGGTDSGGSAGVQADSRSMALLGVHACVAVTAVTVQNSLRVSDIHVIPPQTVADQVRVVVSDIGIGAAKTGMLATEATIEAVAQVCTEVGIGQDGPIPLVVDPVSASIHGDPLLPDSALDALRHTLIPLATVLTPNLDEVRLLVGIDVTDDRSARRAAEALHKFGQRWTIVKGGHLRSSAFSSDLLYDGERFHELSAPRVGTDHDHGAGDTLATATACALAHGYDVPAAIAFAKEWTTRSLKASYPLGAGHGPVSALWRLREH